MIAFIVLAPILIINEYASCLFRSQSHWINSLQKEQTAFESDVESHLHRNNSTLPSPKFRKYDSVTIRTNSISKIRQKGNISYKTMNGERGNRLKGN